MRTVLLNLWAWVLAHPGETMGGLYLVLNAINALIPVEARKASNLARWLDRACVLTQRGAANATSWPVVGRSIARAVVEDAQPDTTAPQRPSVMPPKEETK